MNFPILNKEVITFIYADMSTYEGMEGFVNDVLKVSDKIDWLVCNTAIGTYKKFEEYDYELWDTILTTNLSVPTFMVQKFKPHFNNGGKIIFMGRLCGKLSYSSSLVYSVSKAGVHHLAKCLLRNLMVRMFLSTLLHHHLLKHLGRRVVHRKATTESTERLTFTVLHNLMKLQNLYMTQ